VDLPRTVVEGLLRIMLHYSLEILLEVESGNMRFLAAKGAARILTAIPAARVNSIAFGAASELPRLKLTDTFIKSTGEISIP
jgi:hypothetical protein